MNKYKGLFTFDVDNHRYLPIEQADGLISDMNYNPESKEEPKDSIEYIGLKWEDYDHTTVEIQYQTKEEAEKAVEKLKAWKRLKDNGFKFEGIKEDYTRILQSQEPFRTGKRYLQFNKSEDEEWMKENWGDLDLLFGGQE